jgi:hypothetical protein
LVPETLSLSAPSSGEPVLIPKEEGAINMEASWTTTLRTVQLLTGFLPVPPQIRSAYPPRAPGTDRYEVLRGKWFDTDEDLWLWLDRTQDRVFGPELGDKLAWCEAGERLRVQWSPDVVVFRSAGVDRDVQSEETRLVDAEALAELRAGLGESYRRSLLAILADAPHGLTFRELVQAIRERQGHQVHCGTVRAILTAGGFVKQDGRWLLPSDPEESARSLRQGVVQALVTEKMGIEEESDSTRNLKSLAQAIGARLRQIVLALSLEVGSHTHRDGGA